MTTRRFLAVAATALVLSACGTFTDNDVVAKVGDAELGNDELRALAGDTEGELDELSVQEARGAIGAFLVTELLTADLDSLGQEFEPLDVGDLPAPQALQLRQDNVISAWATLPPTTLIDDGMRATYELGADASGVVCSAHILVATRAEAEAALVELEQGADWGDLAATLSLDPSGADDGFLSCLPPDGVSATFVPEFADGVLAAEIGVPAGPVETQFGFHIIRLVPSDELNLAAAVTLRLQTFDDRYDIWVDPRFGEWDPNGIISSVG